MFTSSPAAAPDADRVARLASLATENAAALMRLAPQAAGDLLWLAGFLQGHVAAAEAAAPPRSKRKHLLKFKDKKAAEIRARDWLLDVLEQRPADERAVSKREMYRLAKQDGIGVPREILKVVWEKQWPERTAPKD